MKVAQYGTTIVVIHASAHGLHGLAHEEIPISLSLLQSVFIGVVILLAPLIAAILLWTQFYRIGSWLLRKTFRFLTNEKGFLSFIESLKIDSLRIQQIVHFCKTNQSNRLSDNFQFS